MIQMISFITQMAQYNTLPYRKTRSLFRLSINRHLNGIYIAHPMYQVMVVKSITEERENIIKDLWSYSNVLYFRNLFHLTVTAWIYDKHNDRHNYRIVKNILIKNYCKIALNMGMFPNVYRVEISPKWQMLGLTLKLFRSNEMYQNSTTNVSIPHSMEWHLIWDITVHWGECTVTQN